MASFQVFSQTGSGYGVVMGNAASLFFGSFFLAFMIGIQNLNISSGRYIAVFLTSVMISGLNLIVLKQAPNASWIEMLAYVSGGPLGMVSGMWFHNRVVGQEAMSGEPNE
ncbi:MAG: hypothetical protein KGI54_12760 [Pseudomonadota bacterium]|nr:hypothetical protein [Pseudomonadota bacterium]